MRIPDGRRTGRPAVGATGGARAHAWRATPLDPFLLKRLALATRHARPAERDRLRVGADPARRRRAQRARGRSHAGSVDAFNNSSASTASVVSAVPRLDRRCLRGDIGKSYNSARVRACDPARGRCRSRSSSPLRVRAHGAARAGGRLVAALGRSPARPHHQPRRPLADGRAGVRLRLVLIVVFGVVAGLAPGHRGLAGGRGLLTQLGTCCCRARARRRAVRLRRAHGARGDDRGPRRRLHAHGLPQGPRHRQVSSKPRAAQRAAADDRGRGYADGYLLGGLVDRRELFNYPGIGQEIVRHAVLKDFPVVQAGRS